MISSGSDGPGDAGGMSMDILDVHQAVRLVGRRGFR